MNYMYMYLIARAFNNNILFVSLYCTGYKMQCYDLKDKKLLGNAAQVSFQFCNQQKKALHSKLSHMY